MPLDMWLGYNEIGGVMLKRFSANAIKRVGLLIPIKYDLSSNKNINGPTVIEYTLPRLLGSKIYIMYFASHKGRYIRTAWSRSPIGKFRTIPLVYILPIWNNFSERKDHVASPEVLTINKINYLFTHSPSRYFAPGRQITYISRLYFGLFCFSAKPTKLPSYSRFFYYKDDLYAITNGADVFRFTVETLEPVKLEADISKLLIPDSEDIAIRVRHSQVVQYKDKMLCFFTRVGDSPERIFVAEMKFTSEEIIFSQPMELLRPETDYEGIKIKAQPSRNGMAKTAQNAIRDPFVAKFGEQYFLYYATSGEKGIACALLNFQKIDYDPPI